MPSLKVKSLPVSMPKSGVYLFSEASDYLYVGRSRQLRNRLRGHCLSSSHHIATFAFLLARKETGLKATYTKKNSRAHLMEQEKFRKEFAKASKRTQAMDIRFVEETDPVRQALLEIYAAISLRTSFNKFETT
jgi:excinuclease UvrABC nuclease subunit